VTLVQGQQGDHDAIWSTDDGSTFSPVEIGTDEDEVGRIVALGSGFAAPGGVYEGNASRPVVWLSADGTDWSPVDVPVEQPMIAASALRWGHRLLVALTSESGPEVRVLDNPEALLAP
jgi:hypothetical protein